VSEVGAYLILAAGIGAGVLVAGGHPWQHGAAAVLGTVAIVVVLVLVDHRSAPTEDEEVFRTSGRRGAGRRRKQ
jgi:hypothetical protein